jgi:hypothetical protein
MLSNHALSIITGFLAGMVFIAGMSNISTLEAKDYWQTIGSLSAGFGTLAILVFGWLKADDWIKSNKQASYIDLNIRLLTTLVEESSSLSAITREAVTKKNKADFESEKAKAVLLSSSIHSTWKLLRKLNASISAHSDVTQVENLCLDIQIAYNHKDIEKNIIGLDGRQFITLINSTARLERIIKRNIDTAMVELLGQ